MSTRAAWFIHLFVAVQLALPLSYYTCGADRYDERFAWRMFSPIRMVRCRLQLAVGDERTPVSLYQTFHEAWVSTANRGRSEVVLAMAHHLCRQHPGQPVYVDVTCHTLDDAVDHRGGSWNVCPLESL